MNKKYLEILLVEDNPDDVKIIQRAFEKYEIDEECSLHVVHDGIEALQYIFGDSGEETDILAHYPILILLDLNLPRLHGLEILKKLKSHKRAQEIPVIVLTASDKKSDCLDAHAFGAENFIQKSGNHVQYMDATGWAILFVLNEKTFEIGKQKTSTT